MAQKILDRLPALAGALGAICIVIGIGYYLVIGQFDRTAILAFGVGVALLLITASYYPGELLNLLRGRSVRYSSNTFAAVVVFLAIVALINYYSSNHSYRWDLTESKDHTLSPQTVSVINSLQGPLKVTSFNQQGSAPQLEDLLKEYSRVSDNKISTQFIDPDRDPATAREYKITRYGTTILEYQGKRQDISGSGEQDITSAILKLERDKAKKVYFLAGHGEINIDSFDSNGGDQVKQALQAEGYEVTPLSLAAAGSVPDDASVLIIAGAKNKFLDEETTAINDYLNNGGKAFVMVDPQGSQSVIDILKNNGIEVGNGIVVDPAASLANQPQVPVVLQYQYSQITKDMAQMSLFPLSTSLAAAKELPKGLTTGILFQTTGNSWLETDPNVIKYDEGQDVRGPLNLGMTEQQTGTPSDPSQPISDDQQKPKMRLVAMGDSLFATNNLMSNTALGNRDLFVNSVNWLAEDENLITIRAKQPTSRQVFLSGTQESFVFYSSVVFLPLVVLVAGAAVWWRGR